MSEENETTAVAVVHPAAGPADLGFVRPAMSVEQAAAAFKEYQDLTKAILDPTDYQTSGERTYKKKSAWRKYMRAFGLDEDTQLTRLEVERDRKSRPIHASAFVVIRSPNGKTWAGAHECHVTERCCPAADGEACGKESYESHRCCEPDCSGRLHWSNPGDIVATAHTRAKNRAISDAIGAGEVSAEEIGEHSASNGHGAPGAPGEKKPNCPNCGHGRAVIKGRAEWGGGWVCWKRKEGCGLNFEDEAAKIETPTELFMRIAKQYNVNAQQLKCYLQEKCGVKRSDEDVDAAKGIQELKLVELELKKNQRAAIASIDLLAEQFRNRMGGNGNGKSGAKPTGAPDQRPEPTIPLLVARISKRLGSDGSKLLADYLRSQVGITGAVLDVQADSPLGKRALSALQSLADQSDEALREIVAPVSVQQESQLEMTDDDVPF